MFLDLPDELRIQIQYNIRLDHLVGVEEADRTESLEMLQ